eukprot:705118-Rhodomonas_salina.3
MSFEFNTHTKDNVELILVSAPCFCNGAHVRGGDGRGVVRGGDVWSEWVGQEGSCLWQMVELPRVVHVTSRGARDSPPPLPASSGTSSGERRESADQTRGARREREGKRARAE